MILIDFLFFVRINICKYKLIKCKLALWEEVEDEGE